MSEGAPGPATVTKYNQIFLKIKIFYCWREDRLSGFEILQYLFKICQILKNCYN